MIDEAYLRQAEPAQNRFTPGWTHTVVSMAAGHTIGGH